MFAFGKNRELLNKLEIYLNTVLDAMKFFRETMDYMLQNGNDEHFKVMVEKVHRLESNADDSRRGIEHEMYEKSLLPETREDLLMIIETIDKIPNEAEAIANDFVIQKTILFPEIKSPFMELINLSVDSVEKTLDATRDCFGKRKKIAEFNLLIDNNESLGDSLEREMISKVFETELPSGDKLIQKDLIIKLGNICDLCENVLDKIVICSVKRQI